MWSRREQVQAYRFLTRRIGSALLSGEPETNELPMRRFGISVAGSIAIAGLVFAGVAVYGLLRPAGREPVANAIIVERETGAKYLYLNGLLHPVLNWTSARLVLGEAQPAVRTMAGASLRDVPRGRPVGIPDAPDALPGKGSLVGAPVTVCTAPRAANSVTPATHVLVGRVPAGGTALGEDDGLLVTAGDERYLLWRDTRLRIRDNATLAALGWAAVRPTTVGLGFLNAVPAGPDLVAPKVPGAGATARTQVAGAAADVGDLFRAAGQSYVMVRDGLAPVGEVAARLAAAGGAQVTDITPQEAGAALVEGDVEPPGYPTDVPKVRGAEFAMACATPLATYDTVDSELTLTPEQVAPSRTGADGVLTADRVAVPGGHAALVKAATGPGATYLVTDQGLKHPLPAEERDAVLAALGYAGVAPVPVPDIVLALIPTATALDPKAATLLAPPATVAPRPTPPGEGT
ncbi:type VII secretion protein EccB [Phytohabitans flavus]|uniref:Type VII secretion protein EccB n=1 Tax=Phytohabitans flavus TaxID=1076124 RepID=A0A6F8XR24_9ACTN|nr:type VII secretion protein EccB [Phytohabitans flavus]BCB76266.1 type VII secretion protein EccB [Phytohabitans flavus]